MTRCGPGEADGREGREEPACGITHSCNRRVRNVLLVGLVDGGAKFGKLYRLEQKVYCGDLIVF